MWFHSMRPASAAEAQATTFAALLASTKQSFAREMRGLEQTLLERLTGALNPRLERLERALGQLERRVVAIEQRAAPAPEPA